jgi:membrane associated rhomboid family serine protease
MNPYTKNPVEDIRRFFMGRTALSILILINIGVWLLVKIINVFYFLFFHPGNADANELFIHFLAIPAYPPSLIKVPWTFITYMFLHFDFWHILFNLLWLFWFGKIFLEYLNSRQLFQIYLTGGLIGAIFYVTAFNFFPVFHNTLRFSYALGASASVMAIVTAISFYVPNYTIQFLFIGRVKIIYLAIILFIFDFFAIPGDNSGGHIAHIGGAIWGFIYVLLVRRGFKSYLTVKPFDWMIKLRKRFFSGTQKKDSFHNFNTRPVSDEEYNIEKKTNQQKIDEILEKISKGGYESLTKSEKEFLFKSSGKNR